MGIRTITERPFRVLSVCSGGGGLDLGLRLACRNAIPVCHVEIEAYAIEVLASRMEEDLIPKAPIWSNLKTFDGVPWRGVVDCIVGGYPCQPWSLAGKRAGRDDPRHLWPHIARLIREIGPQYCFFENVMGHLTLGFDEVAKELQDLGYGIDAGVFSAYEVGASHIRKRLFFLASRPEAMADAYGRLCLGAQEEVCARRDAVDGIGGIVADAQRGGCGEGGEFPSVAGMVDGEEDDAMSATQPGPCGPMADAECSERRSEHGKGRRLEQGEHEPGKEASGSGVLGQVLANPSDGLVQEQGRGSEVGDGAGSNGAPLGTGENLGDAEGMRGDEVERFEPDRVLQAMERYGVFPVEGGFVPLFPPGPDAKDEWGAVVSTGAPLEPSVCDVADELASGLAAGNSDNRIDQLRLLGNGVVPACAAYAFGVLYVNAVARRAKEEGFIEPEKEIVFGE